MNLLQPQGHVQVLLNVLRGYTVQAALDAPRFCISAGMPDAKPDPKAGDPNSTVYFEDRFSEETLNRLRGAYQLNSPPLDSDKEKEMGHDVAVANGFDGMMGRGQIIQKVQNKTGRLVWAAGSDGRGDGHAVAQI